MECDNFRVESAISATASGNLTYEQWPYDVATAKGFAARRNPLGAAVVAYLSNTTPTAIETWEIVLLLATALINETGVDQQAARELAWRGFEWWRDTRCTVCGGRGIVSATRRVCPECQGSGRRALPDSPSAVRDAIDRLVEAEQWMDSQLGARLRRGA